MNDITQIVRRNICCHTDRNTCRSIYQQVWITGRKNGWFFFRLVKVWHEVYGIFVDIGKHSHGNLGKSCLCVTHGSSAISIHRTKVTMSVDKWISGRPRLCHVDKCPVNGAVPVRMVFTHRIPDNTRTFTMWLVRTIIQLYHGIQDTPLYRL